MQLHFRTNALRRCFEDERRASRRWGAVVGQQYVDRLWEIQTVPDWDALSVVSEFGFHPLRGDRAGEFAVRLTGAMRLIVLPGDTDRDIIIWNVENYHV